MKKILIIANHDVNLYNQRKELINKLIYLGYEIHIAVPRGTRTEKLKKIGILYHEVFLNRHGKNLLEDFGLYRQFRKIIAIVQPAVILTYSIKPNIYGSFAAKKYKIPVLANVTGLGTPVENKSLLQPFVIWLYQQAFKMIDVAFFQNKENLLFFKNRHTKFKQTVLLAGSGVNLTEYQILPYPNEEDGIHFVFISRIMREKGADEYFEAAKRIKAKYPEIIFHVCGFCEAGYQSVVERLHQEGTIIYHGLLNDIREILKITHCTVHPTFYPEGMSNVLLESAAAARPIITANRSGTRETIIDGLTGFIVKSEDVDDLVVQLEKFIKLYHQDKVEMGLAGRKYIEEKFDRQQIIDSYLKKIEELI